MSLVSSEAGTVERTARRWQGTTGPGKDAGAVWDAGTAARPLPGAFRDRWDGHGTPLVAQCRHETPDQRPLGIPEGGMALSACPETERFAALLRSLKSRSGLSYEALARKSGLAGSTLHRYCRGTSVPQDYGSVHRLATVCGATPDELRTLHRLWALADAARAAATAATAAAAAGPGPAAGAGAGPGSVAGAGDDSSAGTGEQDDRAESEAEGRSRATDSAPDRAAGPAMDAPLGRDPVPGADAARGRDAEAGTDAALGRAAGPAMDAALGRDRVPGAGAARGRDAEAGTDAALGRAAGPAMDAALGRDRV
ncbi:helix-turn-helix domain-containing protein, partial [Streptomyces luteogriseus]|uniref:helix-turn-helix domain-containing protein n=1 Tax=Streptomyces luteogriseus TaxID=68233 RepID=UPI003722FAB8